VIMKYNGSPISQTSELLNYLNRTQPKQTVQLEVLRDDKAKVITATLTTAPDDTPAKSDRGTTASTKKGPILGVAIRTLNEIEKSRL
ncbi:PDZ domain-containing protein, partial [Klebsiella pneumoniae]|nr:PDZ domain-containing protein [Klebsiella pneumoniae]